MTDKMLVSFAKEEGFVNAAVIDTSEIVFDPSFRPYCAENLCGKYGVNYSCPPDCGTPEEMKKRVLEHKHAIVLQSIWPISNYKDGEAIKKAKGVPADMLSYACQNHNICRINVDTDIRMSTTLALRKYYNENPDNVDTKKYFKVEKKDKESCSANRKFDERFVFYKSS